MAIKYRNYSYLGNVQDSIKHFMPTAGAAGGIVCHVNTGSFTSDMDDPGDIVGYVASPVYGTTRVAGLLMFDVLDYDPTQVERNFQNPFEVVKGSKVWVVTSGTFETNMITEADVAGLTGPAPAYLGASGLLTTEADDGEATPTPYIRVGRFESGVDSDGYVSFTVDFT